VNIKLQERDLSLLKTILRYGVLSTKQITSLCFANIAQTTVLRRLRLLQEAGVLINCGHLSDGAKVWSISKLGCKMINEKPPFRFSNRNTHQHDVCLVNVRLALESMGLSDNWTSEFEMKRNVLVYNRQDRIIPDGVFVAELNGETHIIALELELHAKSHARYRNLFIDYTFKDAISLIWYVVKDESIIKPILKEWRGIEAEGKRWNHPQKIIFCIYNDLVKNKLDAKIMNDAGEFRTIESLINFEKPSQPLSTQTVENLENANTEIQNKNKDFGPLPKLKSKPLPPSTPPHQHQGDVVESTATWS